MIKIIIDADSFVNPLTHSVEDVRNAVTLLISTDFIAYTNLPVKVGQSISSDDLTILLEGKNKAVNIYRVTADMATSIIDLAFEARETEDTLRIESTGRNGIKLVTIFS